MEGASERTHPSRGAAGAGEERRPGGWKLFHDPPRRVMKQHREGDRRW